MDYKNVKTAIIGGGASGLAAAIACSKKLGKGSTVIIERQPRTGRKLLATGNGRCNITNINMSSEHYYGDKSIIDSVLSEFSVEESERFFGGMGIIFRSDGEGRMYPYSNQATTVLDGLRLECERLGVEEICDFLITYVQKKNNVFLISSKTLTVRAKYVVFATGSQASPLLGANGSGYGILSKLGIETSPLFPALSPISTKEKYKNLKGVRTKGKVSLIADEKPLKSVKGEIQFTDYGLSGICVFEISRFVNEFFRLGKICGTSYGKIKISVDVMNEYSYNELYEYLCKCRKIFASYKSDVLLSAALNKKLSQSIARYCGLDSKPCFRLTDSDIKKIVFGVKKFEFTPIITDSYKSAQVSAGGINSDYIDPVTLMSNKIENLFVVGELLDVDGECGGYNLHFAFGSAMIPAKYMK